MAYKGSQFYDDEQLLNKYLERRRWNENANDTIEKPVFMDLIGDVTEKNVLDLGCGTAAFGKELLGLGARSYTGIEGSEKMVELAQETLPKANGKVIHTAIEAWEFPASAYDLVVGKVIKYHRSIEDYFGGLQKAGFVIESLKESKPREENFHNPETYHRRMKIPLFLLIKARKVWG